MEDLKIIELYEKRDEEALKRTAEKYSPMIRRTAENVLGDRGRAEETENDVYLRTWNSIPPARPNIFPPGSEKSREGSRLTGSAGTAEKNAVGRSMTLRSMKSRKSAPVRARRRRFRQRCCRN